MDILSEVIKMVLMVTVVPILFFLIFFLPEEISYWKYRRNLACYYGKKPHLWSDWSPPENAPIKCQKRICSVCNQTETRGEHDFEELGTRQADCEPYLLLCKSCGFMKTNKGEIDHDLTDNDGYSTLYCRQCGKEYPLL